MPIIEVQNVTKVFPARRGARDLRGRGGIGDWIRGRKTETFEALKDITLSVDEGESLGIIGRNGSGKSTLLALLAGVSLPTFGTVTVRGRVASLLELGAGFHPILTGRENVYLNAGLLGMRHAQVDEVFDQIVAFSGVGDFIDQPVETYSSGMYVRIGFAVAVHVNPDVFLVDEVLSVGDEEFQRKCRRKIGELREQRKTIVFVSHDLGIVNTLCERVVLLDRGRMISRGSVQKTISFYLRQVGRERGIHTLSEGSVEVIHCDGRISMFQRQEEVTAPDGFAMRIESLGQYHPSTNAEWEVMDHSPVSCVACGQMTRLPITLFWTLRLEGARLRWEAAFECRREIQVKTIDFLLLLPTAYEQWTCGDTEGKFPEIRASDAVWNVLGGPWDLTMAAAESFDIAALPVSGSSLPPVVVRVTPRNPYFGVYCANTEYVLCSRMLLLHARFPDQEQNLAVGRYELVSIEVDVGEHPDQIRKIISAGRTLHAGRLTVEFERGLIRLEFDEQPITAFIHVYTSMLIQQLWNDSLNLHWRNVRSDGQRITVSGESRRFPFRQDWEIEARQDAIALRIWLDVLDTLEVQEYHTSIALRPEYDRWETEHEHGRYAPFDPSVDKWVHQNKTYAPGKWARALSSTLPSVTLEATTDEIPFRMTAINTIYKENARVLQALRPSDVGRFHFEKGRYLYFSGLITVTDSAVTPPVTTEGK